MFLEDSNRFAEPSGRTVRKGRERKQLFDYSNGQLQSYQTGKQKPRGFSQALTHDCFPSKKSGGKSRFYFGIVI